MLPEQVRYRLKRIAEETGRSYESLREKKKKGYTLQEIEMMAKGQTGYRFMGEHQRAKHDARLGKKLVNYWNQFLGIKL